MKQADLPKRMAWALEVMSLRPTDHVMEIGCGRGEAVTLICAKLNGGTITALDRSEKMIAIARARNASCVAAGVATFHTASPEEVTFGDRRFDVIFAINVGSLWRQRPPHDLTTLRDLLASDGKLFLFHEPPPGSVQSPVTAPLAALEAVDRMSVIESRVEDFGRTRCAGVVAVRSASLS